MQKAPARSVPVALGLWHVGTSVLLGCFLFACSGADTSGSESDSSGAVDGNGSGGATSTRRDANTSPSDGKSRGGSDGKDATSKATSSGATRSSSVESSSIGSSSATVGGHGNSDTSSVGGSSSNGTRTAEGGGAAASNASTTRGTSTSVGSGGHDAGGSSSRAGALTGGRNAGGNVSRGGSVAGGARAMGGKSSIGGATGTSSVPATGGTYTLDCGPIGWAVEAHGPPENRVNYAILGDGYLEADLVAGGKFEQHINKAMKKRFSVPIGEVYSRYRNFVNICAIKLVSTAAICSGNSALRCCGDDNSRLANCSYTAANSAFKANLPASFTVDWRAIVLNGNSWWNTGSELMLWSGAHADAAGAALHEGGHGFHWLADEYTEGGTNCTKESPEVNSTADAKTTAGKWDLWLNYNQVGATGLQSTFEGSNYCTQDQYRPSDNSMMNMLFGDKPDTSFNSVSREQMIFTIWRALVPIDSTSPAAGAVSNPTTLSVKVIDPAVIDVDWSVDGTVVKEKGGERF
ncbi:MAG TPA: M64 family metallopeptidase, partial [Polyangiaceae bacterium]|nr:M64 family metallopeptidase [Polyangiaceae bacterium]